MRRREGIWACAATVLWPSAISFAASKSASRIADAPQPLTHANYKIEVIGQPSVMHGIQGLAIGPDGAIYAGSLTGGSIYRIDIASGAVTTFLGPPRGGADDLAFAPNGAIFWTGLGSGNVLTRGKDGRVRTLAQDMPGANAVGFSRDGRLFVSRIFGGDGLYELDPAGVKPRRTVAEQIGGLNAFQIGDDGGLYGPLFHLGKIVRIDIETGAMTDIADGFESPSAVKIEADGKLIALDYLRGEVVRVDPKSGEKAAIAKLPPPVDNLAIGKDGTIYVSSTAYNGITAIDPKTLAQRRVTWGDFSAPGLLTVLDGEESEELLVADIWGPRIFDPSTGESRLIKRMPGVLGATSIVAHGKTYILGIAGGSSSGSVQVVERATGRLLANYINFGTPYDIKPIADGVVVADYSVGRLTKIGNDEHHTRTIYAWDFDGPVGLADAGNGALYVSEYRGGRITRVDPKTNDQDVVIDGLKAPEGIALGSDGRLIVAEVGRKRVIAVDTATRTAQILADNLAIGPVGGSQTQAPSLPTGVALGKSGAIYVTSDIANVIYRLTPP